MPDRRRQGRVKLQGVMTVDEAPEEGAFARLIDRLVAGRTTVGGVLVFGFVAATIVTNALFLQDARHPDPLFATRDVPRQTPAAPAARPDPLAGQLAALPQRSAEAVGSIPPPTPQRRPDIAMLLDADTTLVADIQRRLQAARLYDGAIDGVYGTRTRAAIEAYERAAGLPVTGTASSQLLARLTDQATPAAQPMPPLPHPAPAREAAGEDATVRQVQTALNTIGYGPVTADGRLGATTTEAIRRFELDNGMAITGAVSDRLVSRLVAIGALSEAR